MFEPSPRAAGRGQGEGWFRAPETLLKGLAVGATPSPCPLPREERGRGFSLASPDRSTLDLLQEYPLFPSDKPFPLGEFEILPAHRIFAQAGAIGLVGRQVLDVVEAVGGGQRAFMRAVIADQIGAAAGNGPVPGAGVLAEGLGAEGFEFIADE